MIKKFITKDSGKVRGYKTGMKRDSDKGKPRYDLCIARKHKNHMLKRWAELLLRGAEKYGDRNWEFAHTHEEFVRYQASAFRHFVAWMEGHEDEDHAAAIFFNVNCAEYVKEKLE